MKVLIVGNGGREHALAWKVASSPLLKKLYTAPGNPGTALVGENVNIPVDAIPVLVSFAREKQVDLVIVGPELPLAMGLVDALGAVSIPAFGPTCGAALLESSKAFAKGFMSRHGIPTARFAVFSSYAEVADHLDQVNYPVVIKVSGLAAGKGVIVPESKQDALGALQRILLLKDFGAAGDQVIIEERLSGEEVSLMAFSDGTNVCPMIPAQDHKRLLDGDRGPNTGGMGAYAPASILTPDLVDEVQRRVLVPAVDGLRQEGKTFCGVIYAGLILTADGPKVLEFNARFGDPEAQVVLPLLENDILEVVLACVSGRLKDIRLKWKPGSAACIVLASIGYPTRSSVGRPIYGLEKEYVDAVVFHAGTKIQDGEVVTAGGRVLGVTGWGEDIHAALKTAYAVTNRIHFEGMQFRRDIGAREAARSSVRTPRASAYAAAGVSIDSGGRAVEMMSAAVRSTYKPEVLAGIGAFGGLYDVTGLKGYESPVLVASTDGVGTKVKLAAQARKFSSIGIDLVNHCVDDILVQGAKPLFFLDYFAASRLEPEIVAEIVAGIAQACREADCVLLGGETAEMPGVYEAGAFDLAGTIVGVAERSRLLPHPGITPDDVLVGLRSSGPHTNGYSLIWKTFETASLDTVYPDLGVTLEEALLAPHRSYLNILWPLLSRPENPIKALAHLTGGSFIENIPRVLPEGCGAEIYPAKWPVPPLFRLIQEKAGAAEDEMYRVFNMGIGMVAILSPDRVSAFQSAIPEETWIVGKVVPGDKKVTLAYGR